MSERDERIRRGREGLIEQLSQDARERGRLPDTRRIEEHAKEIARRNERRRDDTGK